MENDDLIASQIMSNRIMVGIPMTGLLRSEWVLSRYGQVVPCNWSQVDCIQWITTDAPLKFLVADARNIIATNFVEKDFEWLFFVDHDVILPPTTLLHFNKRMLKGDVPIFSGLYFCKGVPAEPLVFRGRGNSYYTKWKIGDEVWCDAVPCGCTFFHNSIMKVLYEESEIYEPKPGIKARKIFETPRKTWYDPETGSWFNTSGTEDLALCTRIMKDNIFKKAGWPKYQKMKYPFLIDTKIFCKHIDFNGRQYPSQGEEFEFIDKKRKKL